jgi:chromosome segregation ATPase
MFEQLTANITKSETCLSELMVMRELIEKNESFDNEDVSMLLTHIQSCQQEIANLKAELAHKHRVYQTQVVTLESIITQRQNTLEELDSHTNAFELFPELLKFFGKKQAKLQESLQSIKHSLN